MSLYTSGMRDGVLLTFLKPIEFKHPAIPRVGDSVHVGVRTGAEHELNVCEVRQVEWNADFSAVTIQLSELDEDWLRANFREFVEAGWMPPPGAVG